MFSSQFRVRGCVWFAQWPQRPKLLMRSSTMSGVGIGHVVDDATVGEEQGAVGVGRGLRIVGDHHDRLAHLPHRGAHEGEDLATGPRVEVARRLIREDDLRPTGQRPGDGNALLLPSRELRRSMLDPASETDGVDHQIQPALVGLAAGEHQRQGDVLQRRQRRHQVERLEDEADPVAAQMGQLLVVERAQVDVADEDVTARQRVEPGDGVHQGGLAGSGRPHDRRELASDELGGHTVERADLRLAATVGLAGVDGPSGNRTGGVHRRGRGEGDERHVVTPCRGWPVLATTGLCAPALTSH